MKQEDMLNYLDLDYVTSMTRKLIRIPTESPGQNERSKDRTPLINLISEQFKALGLAPKPLTVLEERPNIYAEIEGRKPGPTLILYAHTDTIDLSEAHMKKWEFDPFGGEIKDDRIYGVGAADTKGGAAGVLGTAKAIVTSGLDFNGKIIVLFATAAEAAAQGGASTLAKHNLLPKADGAILADSSNRQIVRTFKGRAWFEFIVHGKSVHSSTPELGINAVDKMVDVIQALKKIRFSDSHDPDLGAITLAVTSIDGRNVGSSIPGTCRITADLRTIPGYTADEAQKKIQVVLDDLMQKDKDMNVVMNILPNSIKRSVLTPLEDPIVRATAKAMEDVLGKVEYLPGVMSTGAIYFLDSGIPTVFFGPGSIFNAHMPNEYVEVARLEEAAKIYILAALNFLGFQE